MVVVYEKNCFYPGVKPAARSLWAEKGNGYPHGLAGDEIPIAAQIVSVAEAYAALLRKESYRDAYSQVNAEKMILDGQCGCFNPKLLDCFELGKEEMRAVIIKTAQSERTEQE